MTAAPRAGLAIAALLIAGVALSVRTPVVTTQCSERTTAVAILSTVLDDVLARLAARDRDALKAADRKTDDEREEAYAAYALDGGTDFNAWDELASIYHQPVDWPGFFWNPGGRRHRR